MNAVWLHRVIETFVNFVCPENDIAPLADVAFILVS